MKTGKVSRRRKKVLRERLIDWWVNGIEGQKLFPWRDLGIQPYVGLITEVLLQRTRADAVEKIHSAFFAIFFSRKTGFSFGR